MTLEFSSNSESQSYEIGIAIGAMLRPGDVIALCGELGAGKTRLAKGLALGLGVADERTVNSPTFVLINQYAGRWPVYHLDLYRLPPDSDLAALGFEDMCGGSAVVIVEWADRSPRSMPDDALWIHMTADGETTRAFTLTSRDNAAIERFRQVLSGIVNVVHRN